MTQTPHNAQERWLRAYYALRAAASISWVALAFSLGQQSYSLAAILLVTYPAWDAVANYLDAARSGGIAQNRIQAVNVAVSTITTIAVIIAVSMSFHAVFTVFGAWAVFSGLLQLSTAIGRWKHFGAQWVMILSGGQSALAGVFFILMARAPEIPSITAIAGYAGLGAFYFLLSAIWLTVKIWRRPQTV